MNRQISALIALSIFAACADQPSPGATSETRPRAGLYAYVLGYDPVEARQILGGAHALAGLDDPGKSEAIDSANRVSRLHPDLTEVSDAHLYDPSLTEGRTDWEVFPSTWWPMSENGTASRWQPGANPDYSDRSDLDRLSPMEKYDLMFYPGQERTVRAVSHCRYRDYMEDPDGCEEIEHPEVEVAGPATAWEMQNQGQYQWVEPERWWGHCNGWASYATTEPLGFPRRDVTVRVEDERVVECTDNTEGCIPWRMADIEALMTELYFSDRSYMSGRRCNERPDEIERDKYGRPLDPACRDMNPGSFHVAVTGLLGRGARHLATGASHAFPAFVIDHSYDYEVWNFPLVRYRIDAAERVNANRAVELVGASGRDYVFNENASAFYQVTMTYWMVSDGVPADQLLVRADQRAVSLRETELNYVLELDRDGRILGGEWIESPHLSWGPNNKGLHPDFLWMSTGAAGYGENSDDLGGDSDNPYIAYSKARALLQCANEPASCAPEGADDDEPATFGLTDGVGLRGRRRYVANLPAGDYNVVMAHSESDPRGNADLYVRVGAEASPSRFDCRPGELGSDETCPVTLQQPTAVSAMVEGVSRINPFVLTLERAGGEPAQGTWIWSGLREQGVVASNEELRFATPSVGPGDYEFTLSGTNDADVYVRVGSEPDTSNYDCRPYKSTSKEKCVVTVESPAPVHGMIRGYAPSSEFRLEARPR